MRQDKPISSRMRMFLISLLASFSVLGVSLLIQWFVYADWLRQTGPLRIVGTSIAAVVTFGFMLRWQYLIRERQREMVRRFELISHMNDRIRNALQAIECVTYISYPHATDTVRQEVDAIDEVLRAVISDAGTSSSDRSPQKSIKSSRKAV